MVISQRGPHGSAVGLMPSSLCDVGDPFSGMNSYVNTRVTLLAACGYTGAVKAMAA